MSETYTYGDYFNISNCHCLNSYKPSIPNYPETPGWYPQIKPSKDNKVKDTEFIFISNDIFNPSELPKKCVCASKEALGLAQMTTIYDCIVLIHIYSEYLTKNDHIINLGIIVNNLRDTHEICLVCKDDLDISWYKEQYNYTFSEMRYPSEEYTSNPMYDAALFKKLEQYEYSLCLTLDCMLNGNGEMLSTFIERDFDYIAAPFNKETTKSLFNIDGEMCGYDEFSLKRNKTAIDICNLIKANKAPENYISYSNYNAKIARMTPISVCRLFAFPASEKDYWMSRNDGKEPFGFIYNI